MKKRGVVLLFVFLITFAFVISVTSLSINFASATIIEANYDSSSVTKSQPSSLESTIHTELYSLTFSNNIQSYIGQEKKVDSSTYDNGETGTMTLDHTFFDDGTNSFQESFVSSPSGYHYTYHYEHLQGKYSYLMPSTWASSLNEYKQCVSNPSSCSGSSYTYSAICYGDKLVVEGTKNTAQYFNGYSYITSSEYIKLAYSSDSDEYKTTCHVFVEIIPKPNTDTDKADIVCNFSINNPNAGGAHLSIPFRVIDSNNQVLASGSLRATLPYTGIKSIEKTFSGLLTKQSKMMRCQVNLTSSLNSSDNGNYVSDWLYDIDKDGYLTYFQNLSIAEINSSNINPKGDLPESVVADKLDCDDWIFDDAKIKIDNNFQNTCPKSIEELRKLYNSWYNSFQNICSNDSSNDGIGDYAACSFCRNPGMKEVADDIDNDCQGACQANSSKSCNLYAANNYIDDSGLVGDGKNSEQCSGLTSPFGAADNFCQAVDNNVRADNGTTCSGYNRAVKWANYETTPVETHKSGSSGQVITYNIYSDYYRYSFKPGSILFTDPNSPGSANPATANAEAFIQRIVNLASSTSVSAMGGYNSNTVNTVGKDTKNSFFPVNEAFGKTRETNDLPDQFIDSFRGELNFTLAWTNQDFKNIVHDKNKWQWKTACVPKDKCDDGANNEGPKNLFKTIPYFGYTPVLTNINIGNLNRELNEDTNFDLEIPFKDVDATSCKFSSDTPEPFNGDIFHPKYRWPDDYLKRPYSDNDSYCLDRDGDGFCGYDEQFFQPTENGLSTYINSSQFPDCDDNPNSQYTFYVTDKQGNQISQQKVATTESYLGWIGFDKQDYNGWMVHPFAPITKNSCAIGKFDFNCNKDGTEGNNYNQLTTGGTPFDDNLETGIEKFTNEKIMDNLKKDMYCYEEPIFQPVIPAAAIGVATAAGAYYLLAVAPPVLISMLPVSLQAPAQVIFGTVLIAAGVNDLLGITFDIRNNGANVDNMARLTQLVGFAVLGASPALKGGRWYITLFGKDSRTIEIRPDINAMNNPVINTRTSQAVQQKTTLNTEIKSTSCFLAGTSILMADGSYKSIENIVLGDRVMAYDLGNSTAVAADVTAVFVRNETKYRIIEYEPVEG